MVSYVNVLVPSAHIKIMLQHIQKLYCITCSIELCLKKPMDRIFPGSPGLGPQHFDWCVHGVQQLARILKSCKPCGEKNTKNKKSKNTIPIHIPSVHQQMWCIYTMDCSAAIQKSVFATYKNMDRLERYYV